MGIVSWIDVKNTKFINCTIQGYFDSLPMLSIENGIIANTKFINCKHDGTKSKFLFFLKNTSVYKTAFHECHNVSYYRRSYDANNANGCMIFSLSSSYNMCFFDKCSVYVNHTYGRYDTNHAYMIYFDSTSIISECTFNNCSASTHYGGHSCIDAFILGYNGSADEPTYKKALSENIFSDSKGYQTHYSWRESRSDAVGIALFEMDTTPLNSEC